MEFDAAGSESRFAAQPLFESGAGGLVSTAADLLAFGEMMLGNGTREDVRILSRPSIALMTTNQISPEQARPEDFFPGFWESHGWGLGLGIDTERRELFMTPGRFGWDGGYGTSFYVDPVEDVIGISADPAGLERRWTPAGAAGLLERHVPGARLDLHTLSISADMVAGLYSAIAPPNAARFLVYPHHATGLASLSLSSLKPWRDAAIPGARR